MSLLIFFVLTASVALCLMAAIVGFLVAKAIDEKRWKPDIAYASAACATCATLFYVKPSPLVFWALLAAFLAIQIAWYCHVFRRQSLMRWKGNDSNG